MCQKISITPRPKKSGKKETPGINATDLNKQIRICLNKKNNEVKLNLEVIENNGVFYFSGGEKNKIGGFDFAILNHENNLANLRNLCYGELRYHGAEKRWNKFLKNNPELEPIANQIKTNTSEGTNFINRQSTKIEPLIVGEIQFGNWAFAYRDFFKVLKADVQNNIDCLIYIVPTGSLKTMLSDGLVHFEETVKIIENFSKVISVPVWVIGLDIEVI